MVKKRVEEVGAAMEGLFENQGNTNTAGVMLDINPQEMSSGRRVTPNPVVPEPAADTAETGVKPKKELINCLRNERVVVRFIPKETAMVHNKNHILYGGMAENATRSFVVPRLNSTGMYYNVLTNDEKDFLEYAMGLEANALSIYRKNDNFWDDSNENGIGRVVLHKQDNYLDLSVPSDYIKYKVLLANKDKIAPSMQELEDRPKATYEFVIISEGAETKNNLSKMDATMQCYMEFGAIKENKDVLKTVIELLEKRPIAPQVKLDYLQGKVKDYIDADPRRFLQVVTDSLLPAKVLIKKGIEAGIISWRNNLYYWREDGHPLCEMGEESTLTNAAKYLVNPKYQELKFTLEAKLKD
jgi:hypothetical protein